MYRRQRKLKNNLDFGTYGNWQKVWIEFLQLTSPIFMLFCVYSGYDSAPLARQLVNAINNRKLTNKKGSKL